MKKTSKKFIGSLAVLTLAAACGDSPKSGSSQSSGPREQREELKPDGSNIDGFYMAKFQTLNGHIVGTIPGSASFTRKDDKLYVYLRLFAGAPKAWHMQAVYTGSRCPNLNDDLNADGYIDIVEAEKVVGKVLIPLDADPGSQAGGRNFYPLGDLSGSYQYERVISFRRFFQDLQSEDRDPEDNIVKIGADKGLSLIGKVVMVQGVNQPTPEGTVMPEGEFPNPPVPETVASSGRRRNWQTLPIACGVLHKVSPESGSPLTDTIPGPVAEVQEGQDHPAPDDAPTTTGGGTSGTTTGTNDSDDGHGPVSDGHTSGDESGSSTPAPGGDTGPSSGGATGGSTTGGEIPVPTPTLTPTPVPTETPAPTPTPIPPTNGDNTEGNPDSSSGI